MKKPPPSLLPRRQSRQPKPNRPLFFLHKAGLFNQTLNSAAYTIANVLCVGYACAPERCAGRGVASVKIRQYFVSLLLLSKQSGVAVRAYSGIKRRGFTLLELSVVLIVISLIAATAFSVAAQKTRLAQQRELVEKMDKIENALIAYAKQNNALPCVASAIVAPYASVDCTAAATLPVRRITATEPDGTTPYVYEGVVPLVTLGLADEVGIDPWGKQFTYAVDARLTTANALLTYPATLNVGNILVKSTAGNTRTGTAVAIVLSHGPNGNGAFNYNTASAVRPLGSSDSNEQENCECDSAGAAGALDAIYSQGASTKSASGNADTFDDVVRFYLRSHFLTSFDIQAD
jgi:prepilin-type N-terminal cleavage/methylation domain-containing protein